METYIKAMKKLVIKDVIDWKNTIINIAKKTVSGDTIANCKSPNRAQLDTKEVEISDCISKRFGMA